MTLGVTLLDVSKASVTTSTSNQGNKVSSSFTPPANCKLYLYAWAQGGSVWSFSAPSNTGGLSFAPVSGPTGPWGNFQDNDALWEADVGSSPSSMTATVIASAAVAQLTLLALAVTGNGPRIKSGQLVRGQVVAGATCPVGPLPVAPTPGNLAVCFKGANKDTANDIPVVAAAGFSKLFTTTSTGFFEVCGADSCIDFTGTGWNGSATNFPNTGDSGNDSASIVVEFEESAASAPLLLETGGFLLNENGLLLKTEGL